MSIQTSYSNARENLASLLEQVVTDQEIVIINRRGFEDVALISASELSSLLETAHLLRSPKNAKRLLDALRRAKKKTSKPQPVDKLREELGLNESV